ncbi:MAG: hypothetical protein IPJ51_12720 [Saprospiraceae bacterium]|nr:hypothetical protein [Saprospiraceae bacterium]
MKIKIIFFLFLTILFTNKMRGQCTPQTFGTLSFDIVTSDCINFEFVITDSDGCLDFAWAATGAPITDPCDFGWLGAACSNQYAECPQQPFQVPIYGNNAPNGVWQFLGVIPGIYNSIENHIGPGSGPYEYKWLVDNAVVIRGHTLGYTCASNGMNIDFFVPYDLGCKNIVSISTSHQSGDFFPCGCTVVTGVINYTNGQTYNFDFNIKVQCDIGTLPFYCQNPEISILTSLYNSTNGSNWTNKSGWEEGAAGTNCDPCGNICGAAPWHGITCNAQGEVTNIELPNNNLSGTLPNTLHNLPSLTGVNLSNNEIGGNLPSDLGNADLTILNLSNNNITGNIPSSLSSTLVLSLSHNQLTGSIPSTFGTSGMLALFVNDNLLCGCFDASLNNLCTSLGSNGTNVNISNGNTFNAPWEEFCSGQVGECGSLLNNCTHPDFDALAALYFGTGGLSNLWTNSTGWSGILTGNCDPCGECGNNNPWYGLTCQNNRVIGIILPNNNLTGPLSPALTGLTELVGLNLSNNNLSGILPSEYSQFANLNNLILSGNNLTGSIPSEYCSLMPMNQLNLANNDLSGCYDSDLNCLCVLNNTNNISDGNAFSIPFSSFCASGDGNCSDNCIDVDGVNDYLHRSNLGTNSDFSVSAWFNAGTSGNGGFEDRIVSFGPTDRLEIGIDENSGFLWVYDWFLGDIQTFGANLRDNNWHHVVFSKSGNMNAIYLDGTLQGSYTVTSPSYGPNFRVGTWTGNNSTAAFFKGKIDDVSIWNIPLGATDISSLQTCELNGDELGLVAHYDFNTGESEGMNGSITMIEDKTSNNNDLTIVNMAMQGTTSNLVLSTTGVYENCTQCSTPPIANCNTGFTSTIVASVGFVTITTAQINNESTSACNGNLTFSFHPTNSETTLTYDCSETGQKNVTLYVTDANGLQSSCNSTFEIEYADPSLIALREIYESTGGPNWFNTIANNRPWFVDCDPCGKIDGTPWFGLTCNINSTLDNIKIKFIDLGNNNLNGSLPDVFSVFNLIEEIRLNNNQNLTGNLPPSFCNMTTLMQINLSNTGLGIGGSPPTIPTGCFLNLAQIFQINLGHNTVGNFTGPLPEVHPNAPLAFLLFNNNKFYGKIPASYGNYNLPSNGEFRFYNNPNINECYPYSMINHCNLLNFTNANISANTGLTPWSNFCATQANACCLPGSDLIIDWSPIVSGTYKSAGNIQIIHPNPAMAPNANIIFSHGIGSSVTIPANFNTPPGSVTIQANGCN